MSATHYVAHVESSEAFTGVPLPFGKSLPFDWPAFALRRGQDVVLQWKFAPPHASALRLTFALPERDRKVIQVISRATGSLLGTFDLQAPSLLQTVQIPLPNRGAALEQGIALRVAVGSDPSWFFGVEKGYRPPSALLPPLLPHALELDEFAPGDALAEFYPRLQSLASVQPFDWRAGAVFDGLWALSRLPGGGKARGALNAQLALFLSPGGRLCYEHPGNSTQVAGEPHALEALYPLSVLAQIDVHHPAVAAALKWVRAHSDEEGVVVHGDLQLRDALSVAPFLAALAAGGLPSGDHAAAAWKQLQVRREYLVGEDAVWSLIHPDGRRHGMDRARSLAAYALGIARTLELIPRHEASPEWQAEGRRVGALVIRAQREDCLWGSSFHPAGVPDMEGAPDIAASALFGLFLVSGVRQGWFPQAARQPAANCIKALRERLTPDGYLLAPAAEEARRALSPFPVGGFTSDAFEDGEFHLPEPEPVFLTDELAPWAMGWMASSLAALS